MERQSIACTARIVVAFIAMLICAPAAFALDPSRLISQYGHMTWTLQDGGIPGAPTAMAQTADGYLWVGTRNGLVRFDGVRFVPFSPPPGEGLRTNRILSLRGSRDGSLWIGTRGGLHRWYRGHLRRYVDPPASIAAIASILEDENGKIWFTRMSLRAGDQEGPICEVADDRTVCHGTAKGVPISFARELQKDRHGNFWTLSDAEVVRWRDGVARSWMPPGITDPGQGDVIQTLAPANDGTVWVGAMQPTRGLGLLRLEGDTLAPFVSPQLDGRKLSVGTLWIDREQMLWVGTQDEGVYRLHAGKVSHFRRADGLSSDTIQNIFEDREGTIWIITTQGIDSFRDLPVASVSSREGLSADLANGVLATSDGTVWINAWHSLDAWRDGKMAASLSARNGLPGEEVTAMFQDRAGTVWLGIERELVILEAGKFQKIPTTDGSPFGSLAGMTQDAQGDIWAVTHTPLMLTRIRERKMIERIAQSVVPFALRAITADPHDGIWFALVDGNLGRYRDGKLEVIETANEPGYTIPDLVAYPDGTIMAITAGGLIGVRDGKAQVMATDNGLPCREVHALLRDRRDGLWLYAQCGVIFVANEQLKTWWANPHALLTLKVFDTFDGAQPARGNFFPKGSVGPDGRLWFANASVAQVIDPERLAANTLPPPVQIEQLVADRVSLPVEENVRLPPKTRDVQIDYAGLSFVVPQKTRFRYRLLGHDTQWQDVGTRRQAFFTDLPPRDYLFQVMASNNDGVWNETGASLAFAVTPTFYQTRTFIVLCVVAALGAAWLAVLLRVRQVELRVRERIEARVAERERIARELHDTLLQGLLSASLQLDVANTQIAKDAPAKSLIERILQLLRQATDEGRNAVRDLRNREPARDQLEQALAQTPADLSMDETIQFRLLVEGTPRPLKPAIRDELYRIAREALANAFRHSQATSVETVLEYSANYFRMVVRDNGCGMDPDVLQSGRDGHWGLSGMRERSTRIGARLKVLSAPGAGTEIDLHVAGKAAFDSPSTRRWTDWLGRLYVGRDSE